MYAEFFVSLNEFDLYFAFAYLPPLAKPVNVSILILTSLR